MTPEKERIVIAEACGWTREPARDYVKAYPSWEVGDVRIWKKGESLVDADGLPNYLYDLNAMHEAEKVLDKLNLLQSYIRILRSDVCDEPVSDGYCLHTHVCATAAQRAEAFLRALNRWTDS